MSIDNPLPYRRLHIANYRLLKKIGSGSYGRVYQAQHSIFTDEPVVAIKQLRTQLSSNQDQDLFIEEARLLRKLKHKHILSIIDAGTADGSPYIVMEYAAGGSLREKLYHMGSQPFTLSEAFHLLEQLGDALTYAHEQGIVHRDLKPENILFSPQGDVLLADFGLAVVLGGTQTLTGKAKGSPHYMAPEQFEGVISTRCDLYALGCIAYEILCGRKVFDPAEATWEMMWHLHHWVEPIAPTRWNPALPASVERVILKALAKQRTDRFEDVEEFLDTLRLVLSPENILSPSLASSLSSSSSALPAISPEQSLSFRDDPETLLKQGEAFLHQHKYVRALGAYTKAIRLAPNSTNAWLGKGEAHIELQQYEKALASYEEVLHLDVFALSAWLGKANALCGLERYEEALAAYDQVLKLDEQNAAVYWNKGNILALLKRYTQALDAYEMALALKPEDAYVWQNKGTVLYHLRRYSRSLAASERALHLDPRLTIARQNIDLARRELHTS